MSDKEKNIASLEAAMNRLTSKESSIYFLAYDTKNNARASIKHIYDMALILREKGYNSKILVESKEYNGVKEWLGDRYNSIPVASIKDDKIEIMIDDAIIVPEQYSNILPQLSNFKCIKIMLVQQKEYMFETLAIGSRWSNFGFDRCITTTKSAKEYILNYFPETLVYVIPPYIEDIFKKSDKPIKPYIAISCRDRVQHRKIISEFYAKYPHLRWITFRDMVQMTHDEFAESLKECMVSVWVDDDSTFGTFPLESMKCGVPVVGKIPHTDPDWLGENGFWTYDGNKVVELLGTFVMAWIEGVELESEVIDKMTQTVIPYNKENHNAATLSIFNTLIEQRIESIKITIDKIKNEVSE